jgi:hypothetical protein
MSIAFLLSGLFLRLILLMICCLYTSFTLVQHPGFLMRSLLRHALFGLFLPVLLTGCRAPDKYSDSTHSTAVRWEPGISQVPDVPTYWKADSLLDTLEDRTTIILSI